jgi:SAM-dependent methyltransferase
MEACADRYLELMGPYVKPHDPSVPFISSVTNQVICQGAELSPSYWVQNLVSRVKFSTSISQAINFSGSSKIFLEIGPHSTLAGPIRQILKIEKSSDEYVNVLSHDKDSHEEFLRAVGQLWLQNYPVALEQVGGKGVFLTDLPLYPWHYEEPLWYESRLAKEYRLREFPHHELLGSKILESTTANPGWRNVLRLEDVPWIKEHEIEGDIVLPGVSYLYMAGEAVRQLTGKPDFTCRKVHMKAVLVLTGDDETEIITQLNRVSLTNALDSEWYDFSISSYQNGSWVKHAFGQVRGGGEESEQQSLKAREAATRIYPRGCSSKSWYRKFRLLGIEYGPRFTPLEEITVDPLNGKLAASMKVDLRPGEDKYYSIFPGTLDGIPQSLYLVAARGLTRNFDKPALITYIDEFYLCPPTSATEELKVLAEITEQRATAFLGDVVAVSSVGGGQVVVKSRGWHLSHLVDTAEADNDRSPHGAAELEWREDIDLVDAASFIKRIGNKTDVWEYQLLDRLSLLCFAEAYHRLRKALPPTREHLNKFYKWIKDHINGVSSGASTWFGVPDAADLLILGVETRNKMIEDIYSQLQGTPAYAPATAIHRICFNCEEIFNGTSSELEILLTDGILQKVYDCLLEDADLSGFLSLVTHKRPNLRVLEIGAGTGGATATILPTLRSAYGEKMYLSYTYTDISAGFFSDAKERFKQYTGLEFAVLDISKDPFEQGFKAKTFDLVIACNVLHATANLHQTLSNVRKLVHPEGRLLLQELDPRTKWIGIFGVLEGWWLGQPDGRTQAPYVNLERWTDELTKAGFESVTSMYDGYMNNNIISQPAPSTSRPKRVTVLHYTDQDVQNVRVALEGAGYRVNRYALEDPAAKLFPDQDVMCALDLSSPFFANLDQDRFTHFQRFINAAKEEACGIFWLTGPCQIGHTKPEYATVLGLARVLRTDLDLDFAILELEDFGAAAKVAPRVFGQFQKRISEPEVDPEYECAHVDGKILISRYSHVKVVEEHKTLPAGRTVRKLEQYKPGIMNTLYWKSLAPRALKDGEVRVKVRAAAMNFRVRSFSPCRQPHVWRTHSGRTLYLTNYLDPYRTSSLRRALSPIQEPSIRDLAWNARVSSQRSGLALINSK